MNLASFLRVSTVLGAALLACTSTEESASSDHALSSPAWEREKSTRQAALDAYLDEQRVNFKWFKDSPLGFGGVPYVLLRILVDEYPDIWPRDFLGFAPHPDDYDANGKLVPSHLLPYGLAFEDVAMDPTTTTENVFFSCGACHTGRVLVDGKIRHLFGAPNTEVDSQMYTKALLETAKRLHNLEVDEDKADRNLLEIGKLIARLEGKALLDPTWFYGKGRNAEERAANVERARRQVRLVVQHRDEVFANLVGTAIKARLIYETLPVRSGSYVAKDGQAAPPVFGPRPGRMDAYGIASGLVVLHGSKRPEYLAQLPDDHPFFAGLPREERIPLAAQRLGSTAAEWLPHEPAPVDIKSLFQMSDRFHAGWDGNQGADGRVIASGTSSVGDPAKVNLRIHEGMNPFLANLPAPPYPFAVDLALAQRGKAVFEASCASCHSPRNAKIYTLRELGTDPNRANVVSETSREGLIALMRESCKGQAWCTPTGADPDDEYYRAIRAPEDRGYKADVLHGIWTQAPYLHNGSVPTLWHLLHPAARPTTFTRGNIAFDTAKVGFVWDRVPAADAYDNVHTSTFDTRLRGQSNGGHDYGAELDEDDTSALLEHLKTL